MLGSLVGIFGLLLSLRRWRRFADRFCTEEFHLNQDCLWILDRLVALVGEGGLGRPVLLEQSSSAVSASFRTAGTRIIDSGFLPIQMSLDIQMSCFNPVSSTVPLCSTSNNRGVAECFAEVPALWLHLHRTSAASIEDHHNNHHFLFHIPSKWLTHRRLPT